ncbi:MAG: zinc ribbon domain-containing protein [Candidatus Bathyarchaeota archaeon]|nr:zinc ribbon domain-containing protein [Candidatus Bathyarchaeota archaeon]
MTSRIITLNCPYCGALVSKETMKCEYCGADLIETADGSLGTRGQINCSNCGGSIPRGSWLCSNCGEVVTKDVESLKELQRKLRFEQFIKKKKLPAKIRVTLQPEEYIYKSFTQEGFWRGRSLRPDRIYLVTNRRLIKFDMEEYVELLWNKVVSISEIQYKTGFFSTPYYTFTVHTQEDDTEFRSYVSDQDYLALANLERFHSDTNRILENYNLKKKDMKTQVCFLQLEQEFEFEKTDKNWNQLLVKYSEKYPHNPDGVLEFHISKKMKEGKTRDQAIEELIKESG